MSEQSPIQSGSLPELACVVLSLGSPRELADAVRSLLAQDVPVEVVVVNSGGGDPAGTIGDAAAQIRIVSVDDRRFAGAVRNMGLAASCAPFVAFLAADCLAEPGWARARLLRHRAGALAVSSAVTNGAPGNRFAWASYALVFPGRMPGTPATRRQHYGVSYARTLFARFGLFREDLRGGEDTDFNGRLTDAVAIEWAPEVRSAHRHPTSLVGLLRDQHARGARRVLARRQATGRARRTLELHTATMDTLRCLASAWATSSHADLQWLLRALPLIPLAALAYALGALLARVPARIMSPVVMREPRLIALLAFRDEMRYLPTYFENLAPHVDGIVALDDGSVDGSGDYVARQPGVLELIRLPARMPPAWDEPRNQRLLIEAALRHQPDWLLALDADQRVEREFRHRALAEIARADREGHLAYALRLLELWNRPDTYRHDGMWRRKRIAVLFRARRDHIFNERTLHGSWASADAREEGEFPAADLIVYHLRMIDAEDRRRRRDRYVELDPAREWQAMGYDYLVDERGGQYRTLPRRRGYVPLHESSSRS